MCYLFVSLLLSITNSKFGLKVVFLRAAITDSGKTTVTTKKYGTD